MNKKGFTLAEVLITIVIVGIIAAITVPALIIKQEKEQTCVKLKKFYSTISQAVLLYCNNGGVSPDKIIFPDNVVKNGEYGFEYFSNTIGKYISSISKTQKTQYGWKTYLNDGSSYSAYYPDNTAIHFFYCTKGNCDSNHFDGRKSFLFTLKGSNFRTSMGSNIINREQLLDYCKHPEKIQGGGNTRRHYCTRLIQLDGWKISDDYPW